jgi:hypothetical protein
MSVATLERRRADAARLLEGLQHGDRRRHTVRVAPAHALSDHERERIVQIPNEPRFAALPPARIVPMLADEGIYAARRSRHKQGLQVATALFGDRTQASYATAEVLPRDQTQRGGIIITESIELG